MESETKELYYLQNIKAGYVGNSPMFWAKGGNGYTCWLDNCEQFTKNEVERHVASDMHKWRAWPVSEVDAISQRTVDMQKMRRAK